MGASLPSATLSSTARRAISACSGLWSALLRQQMTAGYWLVASVMAASSASAMPDSTGRYRAWVLLRRVRDYPIALTLPSWAWCPLPMVMATSWWAPMAAYSPLVTPSLRGRVHAIGGCAGGAAVAVMPDATGNGYWVVTAGGDVTAFGDAPSPGEPGCTGSVVAAVRSYDGPWLLPPLPEWRGLQRRRCRELRLMPPARSEDLTLPRLSSPPQMAAATGSLRPTDRSSPKATLPMGRRQQPSPQRRHHRRDGVVGVVLSTCVQSCPRTTATTWGDRPHPTGSPLIRFNRTVPIADQDELATRSQRLPFSVDQLGRIESTLSE